jgi:hypothetical protein
MFAKLNNGQLQKYPYTLGMLRKDNANISFPKVLDDATLARFELVKVSPTPRPEYDHTKDFNVTAQLVNGSWVEAWIATDVAAEEVASRTVNQASNVRAERNAKISGSDWTQLDDSPITNAKKLEWATYRQALRDIPAQAGFPWNVTWPESP